MCCHSVPQQQQRNNYQLKLQPEHTSSWSHPDVCALLIVSLQIQLILQILRPDWLWNNILKIHVTNGPLGTIKCKKKLPGSKLEGRVTDLQSVSEQTLRLTVGTSPSSHWHAPPGRTAGADVMEGVPVFLYKRSAVISGGRSISWAISPPLRLCVTNCSQTVLLPVVTGMSPPQQTAGPSRSSADCVRYMK